MFRVKSKQCKTCIYRKGLPWDIKKLESQVADEHGGFKGHRICHAEGQTACCRGFWNRHKNKFQAGQLAQRLHMIEFVD